MAPVWLFTFWGILCLSLGANGLTCQLCTKMRDDLSCDPPEGTCTAPKECFVYKISTDNLENIVLRGCWTGGSTSCSLKQEDSKYKVTYERTCCSGSDNCNANMN